MAKVLLKSFCLDESVVGTLTATIRTNLIINNCLNRLCRIESSSDSEQDDLSAKKRRTPVSESKDQRDREFEKLKALRRAKESPRKVATRLIFEKDESSDDESEASSVESFDYSSDGADNYGTSSDSDAYEDDGFVVQSSGSSDDVGHEMVKITERLSRSSEADRDQEEKYFQAMYEKKTTKKKTAKEKCKPEPDKKIYQRLVKGLRQFATDPNLSDIDTINEFVMDGFDIDEERSEQCICGKEELKYLFYMKNRVMLQQVEDGDRDLSDYALSTFIVGSKCIITFFKAKHWKKDHLKGQKAFETEFLKWGQSGVIGHFRRTKKIAKKLAWVVTISSKLVADDFKNFKKEFNCHISHKIRDAIDVTINVSPHILKKLDREYLQGEKIQKDSRHRFFLKYKAEDISKTPLRLQFYLEDLSSPESTSFSTSEPSRGKDFIKK